VKAARLRDARAINPCAGVRLIINHSGNCHRFGSCNIEGMRIRFDLLVFSILSFMLAVSSVGSGQSSSRQSAGQSSAGQSSSSSSSSSSARHPAKAAAAGSKLDAGSVSNGVYHNSEFGFACKIPAGWVLRTDEMNQRENEAAGETAPTDKTGHVLLAAFSRPPEARAEDVNSSILIAAESVATYPGMKDAAQYFGPLTEIAEAQGFDTVNEPFEFAVGAKNLVRSDFQKDVGKRVMLQSTLVMLAHGYAVSFTFIGGTEDEVEDLIQGLNFGAAAKSQSHR
jgi:hypothetical protein